MAFDTQIAALTIFCEASNASDAERDAIAHVILNRLKTGRWGKTAAAVCLKRMQFSEWNGDAADNANLERGAEASDDDPVLRACVAAFVWARNMPDPTGGATHYHDKSIAPPAWAGPARGAVVTLETPKFIFYAGVK
jgi:N-acetylmuramoyl-L-alanine amidase